MKHSLDDEIEGARSKLALLEATREKQINDAHVFTAADFRIVIEQDEHVFDFEDIVGDCADEREKEDPSSFYYKAHHAYFNGDGSGVYAWVVALERANPATGHYETVESCGGFFSLENYPDDNCLEGMMSYASGWLPQGINIKDIEGAL